MSVLKVGHQLFSFTKRCQFATASLAAYMACLAPVANADENDWPAVEIQRLLAFDLELEQGFSDRDGRREREFEAQPLFRFIARFAPGQLWSGFLEADVLSQTTWERHEPRETRNIARINQAYLRYNGDVDVRLGRWLYRDEREWLLDANIDGVLLNADIGEVTVDAFAGRLGALPRELFEPNSLGDRVNHYGILAEVEPTPNVHYAAFAIVGDDQERSEGRQLSLGVRSYGKLRSNIDYWANAGLTLGETEGRSMRGRGFDVGGTYRHNTHPLQPRLTIGYAWGSGDIDPESSTDRRYRQTGLQSNEAQLGGLAKLRYYGEALDPELSNIAIATAGVGITADERLSLDVIYHHYREVVSKGGSRHIGDGLDLVVGYRPTDNIEIDGAVGWFEPGRNESAPLSGMIARIEIEYSF